MGNKMAPSYANIFMDSLKRRYLESKPLQLTLWKHALTSSVCGQFHSFIFILL